VNAETGDTVTARDRGPEAECGPGRYPGHDVPWLQIIRLHHSVAVRSDRQFGRIDAQDQQSARWSSLEDFQPDDLDGPWPMPEACIRSEPFRRALGEAGGPSLFLGGPCLPDWIGGDADGPALGCIGARCFTARCGWTGSRTGSTWFRGSQAGVSTRSCRT
jgi:hypothetical protein